MLDKIDFVIDSEKHHPDTLFKLATGLVPDTFFHFEKEGIIAIVHDTGRILYYNTTGNIYTYGYAKELKVGRGLYSDVACKVDGDLIIFNFPVYEWIDHYPHCDGEHDRWGTKITGYNSVTFDTKTKKVV